MTPTPMDVSFHLNPGGHVIVEPPADADPGDICEKCGAYLPMMGSHWHCANCGEISSMMGHITGQRRPDGTSYFSCDPDYEENA